MTVSSGFFNSVNHDRKYNASQISNLFEGIINDGVFASIGTSLVVQASAGMTVAVGVGRAWFDKTWTDNDAPLPLVVSPAEMALNRIDAVVVEVNNLDAVRLNSIKIVKGAPASSPVNPVLTNTSTVHQHPLCYISVRAGVAEITQADITNLVGTADCPFITGLLQTMTVEGITAMLEEEFNTWFADIQGQLSGDVAVNLANGIAEQKARIDDLTLAMVTEDMIYNDSSYQTFVGNVNNNHLCAAFIPSGRTELNSKAVFLGYNIANYLNRHCTDITLTQAEYNLLCTKNTWWDICADASLKATLRRCASFLAKIQAIPYANYVFSYFNTPEGFLAEVNLTYTKTFATIADLKHDTATMQQLMNSEYFCKMIGFNTSIEAAFYGANGEYITFLTGIGNFIVPENVYNLNYSIVSGGSTASVGRIKSGALAVTPGQSIAYNVAPHTTGADTTFGALLASTGALIDGTTAGVLGRAGGYGGDYNQDITYGGVGYGAGGAGAIGAREVDGAKSGCGWYFLGSAGYGVAGNVAQAVGNGVGPTVDFVDTLCKVGVYRTARRQMTDSIIYKKQNALNIWGGAGGGGAGGYGSNYYNPGSGYGGGGGFGARGGPGGGGAGSSGGGRTGPGANTYLAASGAPGGAGGYGTNTAGSPGQGGPGVVFLMW